jgi:hypothetical protein
MKLTKKTSRENKSNSTLNTDSSSDEPLSKSNLQCRIKDKSTQEVMEKVDLEKQQDNTLNDTVDYNESTTTTTTTSTLIPIRIEKKKQKKKLKKIAKKTKYLNFPTKDTPIIFLVYKPQLSIKYDYERLFVMKKCSAYKDQLEKLEFRFIRDDEHQYIEYIICSCGKKLKAKDLSDLNEDLMIGYSYKLLKIDTQYISRNSKLKT